MLSKPDLVRFDVVFLLCCTNCERKPLLTSWPSVQELEALLLLESEFDCDGVLSKLGGSGLYDTLVKVAVHRSEYEVDPALDPSSPDWLC